MRAAHLAALSLLLAVAAADAERPRGEGTVRGTVVDADGGAPIERVVVAPEGAPARTVLTDRSGRFETVRLGTGAHRLVFQHIAYASAETLVVISSPGTPVEIRVALVPHAHVLDPVLVEATSVSPLTSGHTASYTLPPAVLQELPVDDALELVSLIPGVVVSGERPFFRGLGFEHVTPLIDGMPAREPIDGEWILPPPDGIGSAELIAGAFGAEHASLSGVLDVRMAEGGSSLGGRVALSSDRFDLGGTHGTDRGDLTMGGPTPIDGVRIAAAWQGRLEDGHLSYGRDRARHSFLGLLELGERMHGDQSASIRLTYSPPLAVDAWKASITLLHVDRRTKPYHDNHARTGWVGFEPEFSRYTTFIASPADADSAIWFDGPPRVPVRERRSTLLMGALERSIGEGTLGIQARVGDHALRSGPHARPLEDIDQVREWIRNDVTDEDDQTEWFYATHGDHPLFDDGRSLEASLGGRGHLPIGPHDVSFGAGGTLSRHRLAALGGSRFTQELIAFGSFDEYLHAIDAHAYLQDAWKSDPFSSVQLGVRLDTRRIDGFGGSASATTISPRIGFHQPMTDVDAIHVQAGSLFQFPTYRTYVPAAFDAEIGVTLTAQRTRAFELGFQRHVSRRIVAYLGFHVRATDDVVFALREPSEADLLFGSSPPADPPTLITRGVELTLDHQLHPGATGQISVSIGKTTIDDRETLWSRRASVRGWLTLRPDRRARVSFSAAWDSGRPYSVCIKPRATCFETERYTGRLPHTFTIDTRASWSLGARSAIRVVGEVRNLFDRRTPTFAFGVAGANVGVDNFIAYYDALGRPGGYLVDVGDRTFRYDISNPATRSAGRSVRLGVEIRL